MNIEVYEDTKSNFIKLFKEKCLTYGDFTLSSGQKSDYYLNSKKILFDPLGLDYLAFLFYYKIKDLKFNAFGGPEVGAIPITTIVIDELNFYRYNVTNPVGGFFVRRKYKGYGYKTVVEGLVNPGDKVVVVDDVLTTGGSIKSAISVLEDMNCEIVKVMCICDRLQGAKENLSAYDYEPLFTIEDVLK